MDESPIAARSGKTRHAVPGAPPGHNESAVPCPLKTIAAKSR